MKDDETNKIEDKEVRGLWEMTLAEFPLFHLSKKDSKSGFIEYKDQIKGKDGALIERHWTVYPDPKSGYPGASAIDTFWSIAQIWKETDREQRVAFGSIRGLLKRRGNKQASKSQCDQIKRDLEALAGIKIDAINAVWDSEKKKYKTVKRFSVFDKIEYWHDKNYNENQLSLFDGYVKLSDEFYDFLQNNYLVCSFPESYLYGLKPTEKLMALHLDKVFCFYQVYRKDMYDLATQVSISSADKYKLKQQIKTTLDGLIKKDFKLIKSYKFEKAGRGKEYVVIESTKKRKQSKLSEPVNDKNTTEHLVSYMLDVLGDEHSENYYRKVARSLPSGVIERLVGEVKLAYNEKKIDSKAKVFVSQVKLYAKEKGIKI